MNYVEITLSDGTIVRWAIKDDDLADKVAAAVVAVAGEADTVIS